MKDEASTRVKRAPGNKAADTTHPRNAAEDVPHVGEEDTADEGEPDHSRPRRNVQLDVEQDGEAREQRGQEIGALCWDRTRVGTVEPLMALARVAKDEVDARLSSFVVSLQAFNLTTGTEQKRTMNTLQTQ